MADKLKSIFITKSVAEVPLLAHFCAENEIMLTARSFIRFVAVKAEIPREIKTIFFGSRRAAEFFLQQSHLPGNCKVACIGETTKKYIEDSGIKVDFCGSKAGDPEFVARELKDWLKGEKLHVALSEQSNRSMAQVLPGDQVEEMIVYRTIPDPKPIAGKPDLMIFTSPSNLGGFLIENQIPSGSGTIAWGKTTEKALKEIKINPDFVLEYSSELELIEILQNLLTNISW